ncbi:MAG: YigZ family protein [Firmicutes bacterium]|jgi:uncharacterized YigZ family protein|nr:YigZ family protein [Bacillota bacterium]
MTFFSVAGKGKYEQKIQRSIFIGHVSPAGDEDTARGFINEVRQDHAQATHNCYAYRIGLSENPLTYYNDHGEPSGTAGRPILGAILKADVTNTVVVVTRYYGGRKLGVRGLIDAYHTTAAAALDQAGRAEVICRIPLIITCGYSELDQVNHLLNQYDASIKKTDYRDDVQCEVLIPKLNSADIIARLRSVSKVERG